MPVFICPGPLCASVRRKSLFDSAFDMANSLICFSPQPVGLPPSGGDSRLTQMTGLEQIAGTSIQRLSNLGTLQTTGVRFFPDFSREAAAPSGEIQISTATGEQAATKELSGATWVSRFPTSKKTSDLTPSFQAGVDAFIAAIKNAGGSVRISATYRPPERAYLMHYAWKIANGSIKPADVPAREGVNIEWDHGDDKASISAAKEMVSQYQMRHIAALSSRHITKQAIDMTVTNIIGKTVKKKDKTETRINRDADLYAVGASYGVIKLVSDPPHWSTDGR